MLFGMGTFTMSQFKAETYLLYKDCKALKYCDNGIEAFLKRKGISMVDFVANGVPESIARSWNDVMVNRVLDYAKRENNG